MNILFFPRKKEESIYNNIFRTIGPDRLESTRYYFEKNKQNFSR